VSGRSGVRSSTPEVDSADPAVGREPLRTPAVNFVVGLQRSAGNAAVTALIARDGAAPAAAPAPAPAPPPDKTGIGARLAVFRFIEAAKKVETDWATLKTATARAKAFGDAANTELKAAGVPEIKVRVKKMDNLGEFDFATWTLDIGKDAFAKATADRSEIGDAADTVYHESRHCEQWFRMARLQAGKGWKASKIATKLGIPSKIAKAAVANPLAAGTGAEATEASAWYESVYGTGRKQREKTLTDMPKIQKKLDAARKALAKVLKNKKATEKQKETARKKVEDLQKKWDDTYAAYRALPEEFDAWAVGDDATTEWILWERT
jgi:hypothetical protein